MKLAAPGQQGSRAEDHCHLLGDGKLPPAQHPHPHRIRHSYAEDMLDHGMKAEVLRILMDHEELKTTVSYTVSFRQSCVTPGRLHC